MIAHPESQVSISDEGCVSGHGIRREDTVLTASCKVDDAAFVGISTTEEFRV